MIATTITTSTPDWLAALIVLAAPAAALIGVFAAQRMEARRQRVAQERDRELRSEERELRAGDYQRQTLHDLQDALKTLLFTSLDLTDRDHEVDSRRTRIAQAEAQAQVTLLTQRIDDSKARAAVDAAALALSELVRGEGVTPATVESMKHRVDAAERAMGEALRALP